MKGVELAVVATTLLLLASSQELDDYVDKEAISKAVDDYKGKARVIHSSFLECERVFLMFCQLP